MNILFLCNEYPPFRCGGIGIFTKELTVELAKEKNNIFVIGCYDVENKVVEVIDGVTIIRLPKEKGIFGHIINRYKVYKELECTIKKNNIELLEVQDFNGLLAFYKKLSCKVIIRLHGSVYYFKKITNTNDFKGMIWKIIEKSSFAKADYILSVSDYTKNKTIELFNIDKEISTIHNGISIDQEYTSHAFSTVKVYAFAGSLIKKKGILELIQAWVEFSKDKHDVKLKVFGKDIENNISKINKIISENNCKSIDIVGVLPKKELLEQYKLVDYCVFPTKAEAFSLAPMEAMAMSKVVLYTDQTSARELIQDNYDGLLIDNCNIEDIKNSLNKSYFLSEAEYNEISKNAYYKVYNNFNVQDKNKENIVFYKNVLGI